MTRAPLALLTVALITVAAWPVSQAIGAASGVREPPVCRHMTAARMLEDPALAAEWDEAVRSTEPEALARVKGMIADIRAVHGCTRELTMPAPAPAPRLPPDHPPIPGPGGLPPGHPPIPSSPSAPLFEAPAVLTI